MDGENQIVPTRFLKLESLQSHQYYCHCFVCNTPLSLSLSLCLCVRISRIVKNAAERRIAAPLQENDRTRNTCTYTWTFFSRVLFLCPRLPERKPNVSIYNCVRVCVVSLTAAGKGIISANLKTNRRLD